MVAEMKHGTVVDFTQARKGSRPYGRKIAVCPMCGRKGEVATFKPNKAGVVISDYTHQKEYRGWYWHVASDWHCMIKEA